MEEPWRIDNNQIVDAVRSTAIVTGTPTCGTVTKDTYALGGISGALKKVHAACGM